MTKLERVLGFFWLVVALITLSVPQARAFDPLEAPFESDPSDASTQFCLTNDGWVWGGNARDRADDAEAKWEGSTPGFNLMIDSSPEDCHDQDARIEMRWSSCWALSSGVLALTRWHDDFPYGWRGTEWIAFFKFKDCSSEAGSNVRPFSFDTTPTSTEYDFQTLFEHEVGHGFGLHHPEAASLIAWPPGNGTTVANTWEENNTTLLMEESQDKGKRYVVPSKDEVAGAGWARNFQYLARPKTPDYWFSSCSGLAQAPAGFLTLQNGSGDCYISMGTRFTTDGRTKRQTPAFKIEWRKASGQSSGWSDRVILTIAWRTVASRIAGSTLGPWHLITGTNCLDDHSDGTWETCTRNFNIGDTSVQDIVVYVTNSTVGMIHLNDIDLIDGNVA